MEDMKGEGNMRGEKGKRGEEHEVKTTRGCGKEERDKKKGGG